MKQIKESNNNNALSGHIHSIPLIIEDKETKKVIKKASLYLHSSRNGSEIKNSNFTNISLTAMNQEGSFHINITKENCSKFKRKGQFTIAEWESIIQHLFPTDDYYEPSIADDLVISAKFISLESYYDSDTNELLDDDELPLVSEFITIDIKTNSKLPITVGSIDLPYADEENDLETTNMIRKEHNLFNWLDLLLFDNQKLNKELQASRQCNSLLKKENEQYKNELETTSIQHENIIDDILDKFYQVLNTKKDKIWALEDKKLNRLEGLNEKYINQNKFNLKNYTINKDMIPDELDNVYTSPNKRKKAAGNVRKCLTKRHKRINTANDTKEMSDVESTEETKRAHPITKSKDELTNLVSATKGLSDKEIVTGILDHNQENPTTDADDLHQSNDGNSESDNVTDYSDNDDYNLNDANELDIEDAKNITLQSSTRQSNDIAKSPSDTARPNSITDYDTDSDKTQKESQQMLNSNTDEIEDSLQ